MNGPHDMGGQNGFGPVGPETDEPVFHAEWERRALSLTLAMGIAGGWTIDMSRSARESLPPAAYLAKSYYEIWIAGLERLMAERGLVTAAEIDAGHSLAPAKPVGRVLAAADVADVLRKGGPADRPAVAPARFKAGDRVRARNMHPVTHTRLPRYVRGHVGAIEAVRGCHVFPDRNAYANAGPPEWLYTVRFAGPELWGEGSDPTLSVSVDAFEPYLEPA